MGGVRIENGLGVSPEQMNHGKELKSCSPASLPPQNPSHAAQPDEHTSSVSVLPLKGNLLIISLNNDRLEYSVVG